MTGRQLELRDERASLVVARTDSWMAVVEDVAVLAQRIAGTELVPSALRDKPPAIAASILYGREIGLPPMTALRSVYVVNGQVALKAEAMRGLILAAGHDLVFTESTSARCVAKGRRKGQETWSEVTWTVDDARKANLVRGPWMQYPRAMLKARATAELARDLFADVIAGFVALEEVDGAEPDVPQHDGTEPRQPKAVTRKRTTPKGGVPGFPSTYPRPSQPIPGDQELPMDPASPADKDEVPSAGSAGEAGTTDLVPLPGEPGYGDEVPPASPVDEPPGRADDETPRDTSAYKTYPAQRTKLHAILTELGVRDRAVRLRLASLVIGRELETSNDLTRGEASVLIDTLEKVAASQTMREALARVLDSTDVIASIDALADRLAALAAIPDDAPPPDEPPGDDPWTPPDAP